MAAELKWVLLALPKHRPDNPWPSALVVERTVFIRHIAGVRQVPPTAWLVVAESDNEAELDALAKLMEASDVIT
tara:strand:- start:9 stop:230 length:222 start_codon:yes stop_codon:yes gene_type:complete